MGVDTALIIDGFKIGMFVFFASKALTWGWLRMKNIASG